MRGHTSIWNNAIISNVNWPVDTMYNTCTECGRGRDAHAHTSVVIPRTLLAHWHSSGEDKGGGALSLLLFVIVVCVCVFVWIYNYQNY